MSAPTDTTDVNTELTALKEQVRRLQKRVTDLEQ